MLTFEEWLIDEKDYNEYEVYNCIQSLFSAGELDYLYQDYYKFKNEIYSLPEVPSSKKKYHSISFLNKNNGPTCGYPANKFSKEESIQKFLNEYGTDTEYKYEETYI